MPQDRLIGITDLRQHAKALIDELDQGAVKVLRRNKPVALLIRPERVDELLDRIEDLEYAVPLLEPLPGIALANLAETTGEVEPAATEPDRVHDLMETLEKAVREARAARMAHVAGPM